MIMVFLSRGRSRAFILNNLGDCHNYQNCHNCPHGLCSPRKFMKVAQDGVVFASGEQLDFFDCPALRWLWFGLLLRLLLLFLFLITDFPTVGDLGQEFANTLNVVFVPGVQAGAPDTENRWRGYL